MTSADSGTRARDVPQIQQREGSTRTNVGKRNKDEAAGNARECAEGGKMVCPAGHPAAIQHGEGDRREEGGGRRLYPIPAAG